jgi:hypothetical protein
MKLYIQDCSWAGSIVVVANSEEEARELMRGEENYEEWRSVVEEEIRVGFIFSNYGDL